MNESVIYKATCSHCKNHFYYNVKTIEELGINLDIGKSGFWCCYCDEYTPFNHSTTELVEKSSINSLINNLASSKDVNRLGR